MPEGIAVVDDALAGVEGRAEIAGGEWLEKKGEGRMSGEAGEDGIIEPDLIILSPGTAVIGSSRISTPAFRCRLRGLHPGPGAAPLDL